MSNTVSTKSEEKVQITDERFQWANECLKACREGNATGANGWNLWAITHMLGYDLETTLEKLGTTEEETRLYLLPSLQSNLENLRRVATYDQDSYLDISDICNLLEMGRITHQELGTTPEEIASLETKLETKLEELLREVHKAGT